jgi:hypothetical protein
MFQIFDGVELDTAGLEQIKRAARITSSGVVIKRNSLHNSDAPCGCCGRAAGGKLTMRIIDTNGDGERGCIIQGGRDRT